MKKLRNRENGRIGRLVGLSIEGDRYEAAIIIDGEDRYRKFYYPTMERFMTKWEDYEEPKKHYEILSIGAVMEREDAEDEICRNQEQRKIGNYFETREEAEKAVEKLKAWKRLKDKGFRFDGWYGGSRTIDFEISDYKELLLPEEICDDLKLLFGGEE